MKVRFENLRFSTSKIIFIAFILVVLFSITYFIHYADLLSAQIQTMEVMKNYKNGDYELGNVDGWGNKIEIMYGDGGFIMVSYGRDGKPDYGDYWSLTSEAGYKNICGDWNADQIKTESRWIQICSK